MESRVVLPTKQFAYRKGLCTCDALLCLSHTLQSALEYKMAAVYAKCMHFAYTAKCIGEWAMIVQIDFSAACDMFKQQGILYKLCSVGIGGSVFFLSTQFLSNRP